MTNCTACKGDFDLETEGGVAGNFGILPMAFCPTCYTGMVDMVHQLYICPHCDKFYDEESEEDGGWSYSYKVTPVRVVDGDTVDVLVDYGFNLQQLQRIRLLGVDTPERGEPDFAVATKRLQHLLDKAADAEGQVKLVSHKAGKYGRWLGWFTSLVEGNETNVNETLAEKWPSE